MSDDDHPAYVDDRAVKATADFLVNRPQPQPFERAIREVLDTYDRMLPTPKRLAIGEEEEG